ncbi:unnamed protein product, partial [Tetraodon nigroviridis]
LIHSKDFDVGKTYKKKITLINSSSVADHCRFLRVSSQLHDFISINFKPPGRLAAGMSCEMQAVFQPTFNKDLFGDVQFSAEAGVFSIPIRCTIKKCDVREGKIGPFESTKLKVIFTPTVPGEARLKFYVKFSDSTVKPIPVHVTGVAVTIPVWVTKPSIDLRICMFDHLYQDVITVQSSASTALKLTFEVCPELRKHMKILPKSGSIQAQSTFNAQLKFLPRCSLSKDASEFFDADTGVLEAPLVVQIAGQGLAVVQVVAWSLLIPRSQLQVKPIQVIVHAVVSTPELQFDPSEVDFGCCSIYCSVKKRIGLTNLSLLPQEFGFVGIPEVPDACIRSLFNNAVGKSDLIKACNYK